jgi:hypothetical protein
MTLWVMSALRDPAVAAAHVRFGPKATVRFTSSCDRSPCASQADSCSAAAPLFDHLVGEREQGRWHGEADCFRDFEVKHPFELGWRLHRKVGGCAGLEDAFVALN